MSNGKQIALGMLMYTNDYDDVLPYVQSVVTVKEITYPYIKTKSVWETGNPASQWRFNMCVGGALETDIQEPASTPMFYESAPWPDGRRVVAFMDGHVKLVSSSDWKAMAKYLKLKLKKKATKPLPLHVPGYGSTG
jgi:prepilin-type processing-associated H-X9-DG protein